MSMFTQRLIAFGPELPEFGSWNWLGVDMIRSLKPRFETVSFREAIPSADVTIFLKFLPELEVLRQAAARTRIVYCPVDVYGSSSEIDADAERLFLCQHVVVHCERLARYFRGYACVVSMEHHLKYVATIPNGRPTDGPLLWIGERSNLPALVDWVNRNELPQELLVLTNDDRTAHLGFQAGRRVLVETWSPERHLFWLPRCRAALDIKGEDFRSRHKPAAKACDFLASGVPLALPAESSSAEFLARRGFEAALPNSARWLSDDYLAETVQFGRRLLDSLSLPQMADRWSTLLEEVLQEPIVRRKDVC